MKKSALVLLTGVNTVAVAILIVGPLLSGGPGPGATSGEAPGAEVEALERRVADLEARLRAAGPSASPPGSPSALPSPEAPAAEGEEGQATAGEEAGGEGEVGEVVPGSGVAQVGDRPVLLSEFRGLLRSELAVKAQEDAEAWKKAQRPKRPLGEVVQELGLQPNQEQRIRELYHGIERQSMCTLFGVPESELETLKAQIAQSEHDPRLKAELRKKVAVNWTRHSSEIGVLWVKLDAELREIMDAETLAKYYANDVQLEDREFPDIRETFFEDEKKD